MKKSALKNLVLAVVVFGIGLVPLAGAAEPGMARSEPERPNIVFILTDDLDARMVASMPMLRSLMADRGVNFENAFVTNSLCCPSRASTLRGQYSHNHGVLTNASPSGGFAKFYGSGNENSTVATWLAAEGYRTALIGKYFNGTEAAPTHVPPGWSEWHGLVGESPIGENGYNLNENGRLVNYNLAGETRKFEARIKATKQKLKKSKSKKVKKKLKNKLSNLRRQLGGLEGRLYQTDVFANKAVGVIEQATRDRQPFFVYLAPRAPHGLSTPAPRHEKWFANERTPRVPSFNEADVSDKPGWVREKPGMRAGSVEYVDRFYRERRQSMVAVNEMISRVIQTLEATGQLDNTYIFFTSDHGHRLGEHRGIGKWSAYDEDIRVPMMVRGPGIPAGETLDHLVLNNDLAPTFAELAGASAPGFVDGRSMAPLLENTPPDTSGSDAGWRSSFLVEAEPSACCQGDRSRPAYEALRTKDHLYVEYETGERELYDTQRDPYQLQSLHASTNPQHVAAREELAPRLEALRDCAGDDCRAAENLPIGTTP